MRVELQTHSLGMGQSVNVIVTDSSEVEFDQLQVDVFTAGVTNSTPVAGKGTLPQRPSRDQYSLALETDHLGAGFYEIAHVRLSKSSNGPDTEAVAVWTPQDKSSRCFFEIRDVPRLISQQDLQNEIVEISAKLEHEFLEPVFATLGTAAPAGQLYTAFVFVRGVLLGTRIRFRHFEIVPLKEGLAPKTCWSESTPFCASRQVLEPSLHTRTA